MGSVGDSYDSALMENFFSTLKTELVYRHAITRPAGTSVRLEREAARRGGVPIPTGTTRCWRQPGGSRVTGPLVRRALPGGGAFPTISYFKYVTTEPHQC